MTRMRAAFLAGLTGILAAAAALILVFTLEGTRHSQPEILPGAQVIPVYGMDTDTYRPQVSYFIRVSADLPLEARIHLVVGHLRDHFRQLRLECEFTEDDGMKIAQINLIENENNRHEGRLKPAVDFRGPSWYQFFQGSCGATGTATTLEETLLQRDNPGEWIDGLAIRYEGRVIDEMDHIRFPSVVYRSDPPYWVRLTLPAPPASGH
jgi:hypothetical protein